MRSLMNYCIFLYRLDYIFIFIEMPPISNHSILRLSTSRWTFSILLELRCWLSSPLCGQSSQQLKRFSIYVTIYRDYFINPSFLLINILVLGLNALSNSLVKVLVFKEITFRISPSNTLPHIFIWEWTISSSLFSNKELCASKLARKLTRTLLSYISILLLKNTFW